MYKYEDVLLQAEASTYIIVELIFYLSVWIHILSIFLKKKNLQYKIGISFIFQIKIESLL